MKKNILPAFLLLSVLAFSACNTATDPVPMNQSEVAKPAPVEVTEEMKTKDEEMINKENTEEEVIEEDLASTENQSVQLAAAMYKDFSQVTYDEMLGTEAMAIYFHADWCPTCKALEKRVTENLSDFPNGTKILKANFDTEQELKDKYNVTTQTTIVVLNANGEVVDTLSNPSNKKLISVLELSL